MSTIYDLSTSANRSEALSECIRQEIVRQGPMTFARFMELALYHPEYGYYTAAEMGFGKAGDFTTAPEISPLFAQCFARQAEEIFAELGSRAVLEIGAGSGRFASDFLRSVGNIDRYYIFEISASLRDKQQAWLRENNRELFERVTWLDKLPSEFTGVILANEVLDALPFRCFRISDNQIQERLVNIENGKFVWQLAAVDDAHFSSLAQTLQLEEGYESEINLQIPIFIEALAKCLQKGVMLIADYGYGRGEYYHPQRNAGTLTCFYQHQHHADPFVHVGLQDITAHVDFTLVIESADLYGCTLEGFTTQAQFLMNCGILEIAQKAEATLSEAEKFNLHQAIKILTFPTEMGEVVKVIALGKNWQKSLVSFLKSGRERDL